MSDWSEGNWSGPDWYDDLSGLFGGYAPGESNYYDDLFAPIDQELMGTGTSGTSLNLGQAIKAITDLFGGRTSLGNLGALVGAGGIGSLLNKAFGSGSSGPAGYQGGIPTYTATRTQTPIEQQRPAGYRPGQGGITYFNPIEYTPATPPPVSTTPPASTTPPPADNTPPVYTEPPSGMREGGIVMLAQGGSNRFLKGGGDGTSDSIPAQFTGSKRPAALADGEFVIDARTVSEIGNGSSEAGARKLYAMMDRVHKERRAAKRGKPSGADQHLNNLVA